MVVYSTPFKVERRWRDQVDKKYLLYRTGSTLFAWQRFLNFVLYDYETPRFCFISLNSENLAPTW